MAIEFNKPCTYHKGAGRHAGEGKEHMKDSDTLLNCAEENLTKLKYCNSELVDPECGRKIMDSFEKEKRVNRSHQEVARVKGRMRMPNFRNSYGSN